MRIVYYADDGKEFDNEEECEEYEYSLRMQGKFKTTRFFDRHGKQVPFLSSSEFCEHLYYIEVNDAEEASFLYKWFNDCGFESPWTLKAYRHDGIFETGRFFYDSNEDCWRCLDEIYKSYIELLDVFENKGE